MIYNVFLKKSIVTIKDLNWDNMSKCSYHNTQFLIEFDLYLNLRAVSIYKTLSMDYIIQKLDKLCIVSLLTHQNLKQDDRMILIKTMRFKLSTTDV